MTRGRTTVHRQARARILRGLVLFPCTLADLIPLENYIRQVFYAFSASPIYPFQKACMGTHTPRFQHRSLTLEDCFHPKAMLSAWKQVKEGMRKQEILDLHDYYDFHVNRETLIPIIQKQIIQGNYQPKTAYILP